MNTKTSLDQDGQKLPHHSRSDSSSPTPLLEARVSGANNRSLAPLQAHSRADLSRRLGDWHQRQKIKDLLAQSQAGKPLSSASIAELSMGY